MIPTETNKLRRQAVTMTMLFLVLFGVSIFLVAAERTSVLLIMLTVIAGVYSGWLFYKIRKHKTS